MSPKNKGKFGKGKSAVEVEDQFISGAGRVAEALRPHVWRIAVAVSAITLVVVAVAMYGWWDNRKETAASELYAEALREAQRDLEGEEIPLEDEDELVVPTVTYASSQERAEAALEVLEQLESEYGGTDVAQGSRLLHGRLLFEVGRYDEALAMFDRYASGGGSPELRAVAREGIGYVYETQAADADDAEARQSRLEKALEAFRAMQPDEEGPMREVSLYHQGRILEKLGRPAEAAEAFRKALEVDPDGVLQSDIELRLAQLDQPAGE